MARKWKLGATGSALLATAFVVVACSSDKSDDDDNGGKGGTGASGGAGGGAGTAAAAGGKAGSATGATGGASGSGTGATAGTATVGGAGGAAAGAGGAAAGAGGAAASGPFACAMPTPAATCDSFSNWGTGEAAWFGTGAFTGGFSVYGGNPATIMRDTDTTKIHITGMVSTYSGFNIWFSSCSSLAAYTGVTFTLSGTSTSTTTPDTLSFQPQTNSDYPWEPRPQDKKGGCTHVGTEDPYVSCAPSTKTITLSATPVAVLWSDAELTASGKPVMFTAAMSPGEIIGLQWQFPWQASWTPYPVDITLDDLSFTTAAGTPIDCGTMVIGSGGMGAGGASSGGMSGAGGAAAGAGGAAAGAGGAAAGAGGAAAGAGGAAAGAGGAAAGAGGRAAGGAGGRGGRGGGAGSP